MLEFAASLLVESTALTLDNESGSKSEYFYADAFMYWLFCFANYVFELKCYCCLDYVFSSEGSATSLYRTQVGRRWSGWKVGV